MSETVKLRDETWMFDGGGAAPNWYRPHDPSGTHVHMPFEFEGQKSALNGASRLAVALSEIVRLRAALEEKQSDLLHMTRNHLDVEGCEGCEAIAIEILSGRPTLMTTPEYQSREYGRAMTDLRNRYSDEFEALCVAYAHRDDDEIGWPYRRSWASALLRERHVDEFRDAYRGRMDIAAAALKGDAD